MMINDKKLAVLIDADNASADIIQPLLAEIAKYGIANVKRIYGDWSSGLSKWKEALLPHAIIPVQQFAYTKGKNATDMAMVIDAMDLLYSKTFDGFCIVSSDSDFTRLASRIRESGLTVYGFGAKKTPEAFRKACDTFVFTENLVSENSSAISVSEHITINDKTTELHNMVYRAIQETADDSGWAELGAIGNYLNKTNPDFDQRSYGFTKLSDLMRSIPLLDMRTGSSSTIIYVRKQSFRRFIQMIQNIIDLFTHEESGWANLNTVCSHVKKYDPYFNCQTLGHKTIPATVRAIHQNYVEIGEYNGAECIRNQKRML